MGRSFVWFLLPLVFAASSSTFSGAQTSKPKVTFDEFFNAVSFPSLKISHDGDSVVIETERADWDQQIFRKDLWLYRVASGNLTQLTQSGQDTAPQWSPDGKWIAFLSERKSADSKDGDADEGKRRRGGDADKDKGDVAHLFLISPGGGEAFPVTSGEEEVHSFAWSADSKSIYFATRQPWSKQQNDDHKNDWKDVIRYRGD